MSHEAPPPPRAIVMGWALFGLGAAIAMANAGILPPARRWALGLSGAILGAIAGMAVNRLRARR